jgi:sugar phosphate isomerase/epimerase
VFATHTKDVAPLYGWDPKDWMFFACTPVGQGIVNFPGLVEELEKAGYNGLYAVELDYMDPKYRDEDLAVKASITYLKRLQKRFPRRA